MEVKLNAANVVWILFGIWLVLEIIIDLGGDVSVF